MAAAKSTGAGPKKRAKAAAGALVGEQRGTLRLAPISAFAGVLFDEDLHAKRVESRANGVAGVLNAATLTIHEIGQAYAAMAHIEARSGVKQIDRLLSNVGVVLDVLFPSWIRFVVGVRTDLIIALDWTEFDADDHVTLFAYAVTRHGRATPLTWKTHKKSDLEGHRTQWEHDLVELSARAAFRGILTNSLELDPPASSLRADVRRRGRSRRPPRPVAARPTRGTPSCRQLRPPPSPA